MSEDQNGETTDHLNTISEDEKEISLDELKSMLELEKEAASSYEKKLQYLLADFENLKKRTEFDVQTRVNSMLTEIMLKFLLLYDDFVRAREVLGRQHVNTEGLDGILKNMNSLLSEYGVTPIDVIGEIFDPKLHEAISVKEDASLDNDTVTKEIRKGYILHGRVIRPSLVEISKTKIEGEING